MISLLFSAGLHHNAAVGGGIVRMPRYFFHIKRDGEVLIDREGVELSDVDAASRVAVLDARTLMSEDILAGRLTIGSIFLIANDQGKIVFEFPFVHAIDVDPQSPDAG